MLFKTPDQLQEWLATHGENDSSSHLQDMSAEQQQELTQCYNTHGQATEKGDIGDVATALGRAIAVFLTLAGKMPSLPTEVEQDQFISYHALALFRLIKGGLSGKEQNFMKESADQIASIFPKGPEADLVHPMTAQAIAQCRTIIRDMKNP